MWFLLACFLIPPAGVVLVGNMLGGIPNQQMWVILLSAPIPIMLFSLPRRYTLDGAELTISGLFYRLRVARGQIRSVRPVGLGRALVYPGSVFCSDPGKALLIEREGKIPLVISPHDPAPFMALNPQEAVGGDGDEGGPAQKEV